MKTLKILSLLFISTLVLTSCSNDDDNPDPIVEEEVITTLTVLLTPVGPGNTVTLEYRDLDGDGTLPPDIEVTGNLSAYTGYTASIELLNEAVSPIEDITEEVNEEAEEHQFFYEAGTALQILNLTYIDLDGNGDPLGLHFGFETGDVSNGNFTIILRHNPNKGATGVSDGDITNAGGETDITATFPLTIE